MNDNENNNDASVWARVALMGHVELAGRLSKPTEWGGLFQLDIPDGETFRTRLFGAQSVYDIEIVREQVARAYAKQSRRVIAYDAPVITREEHQQLLYRAEQEHGRLQTQIRELERRLTAVNALPEPQPAQIEDGSDSEDVESEE